MINMGSAQDVLKDLLRLLDALLRPRSKGLRHAAIVHTFNDRGQGESRTLKGNHFNLY